MLVGQVKGRPYLIVWKSYSATVWLPADVDSNSFYIKNQVIKPLEVHGVELIKIQYLPERSLLWNYDKIKIQIAGWKDLKISKTDGNYLCLPAGIKSIEKLTANTQIKKVILYNNRSSQKFKDPIWDLGSDGVFKIDI